MDGSERTPAGQIPTQAGLLNVRNGGHASVRRELTRVANEGGVGGVNRRRDVGGWVDRGDVAGRYVAGRYIAGGFRRACVAGVITRGGGVGVWRNGACLTGVGVAGVGLCIDGTVEYVAGGLGGRVRRRIAGRIRPAVAAIAASGVRTLWVFDFASVDVRDESTRGEPASEHHQSQSRQHQTHELTRTKARLEDQSPQVCESQPFGSRGVNASCVLRGPTCDSIEPIYCAGPPAGGRLGPVNIHLVDGTFELFRAFYSAPSRRSPDGQEVGATLGLLRSYSSLLASSEVTHVAIAYDHVIESFRNQLFPGYKTGEGIDPALWSQAGLAEQAAQALGLVVWAMVEFEADDAMATAAARWAASPEVTQVVLCSPDKDLAQCLTTPQVVTWDRIRDRRLDAAGVVEKFGVFPASIPDYLALVGDTADGIPGIPRWGAKSAAAVLSHYKHLEAIPALAKDWEIKVRGADVLASNLHGARDAALLYRTLATLRFDVPLTESLEDLEYRGVDAPALQLLCARLGDPELAERLIAKHGVRA